MGFLKYTMTSMLYLLFFNPLASSVLSGKDVLAKAKTGTGKTVAFLVRHTIH